MAPSLSDAQCKTAVQVEGGECRLGVTIALRSYVEEDIRAGRLATPFPLTVPMLRAWYIVYRPY